MGILDAVEKIAKKAVDVAADGIRTVDQLAKAHVPGYAAARDFTSRLANGGLGTQAVPMPEVIQKVLAGNSGHWYDGVRSAEILANEHARISKQMNEIAAGLEAAWTGSSADAAQAKIKPFADVVATAAQSFTNNSGNLNGIAHDFDSVQAAFRSAPLPPRPDKGFWDIAAPWDTDTEKKIAEYNALVQRHLERYQKYNKNATSAAAGLKLFYGQVDPFGDVNITVMGGGSGGSPGGGSGLGARSGAFGGPSGFSEPSGGANPNVAMPAAAVPGPQVGATGPGAGAVPAEQTTTAAGFVPSTGLGTGTPLVAGGGGGPAAFGPGVGVGPVAGLAGGGAGSRAGGPGRGAGAGGPGAAGVPGAGRGNAGAGRGGMSGAPGMVPGAGRGRGADDEEHRRKYGEADDSIFRLEGDEAGSVMIDPNTGLPVPPPTIGG